MRTCPVCAEDAGGVEELAAHLVGEASASDVRHVMWLNRNLTKRRVDADRLATLLRRWENGDPLGEARIAR